MNLMALQQHMKIWLESRGINFTGPYDRWVQLGIVMEEVGETASVMTKGKGDINEEIADIIIATMCLAIGLGVDVDEAVTSKLLILEDRKATKVDGHIRITHD